MALVQISLKGQILIPKRIREKYSVKPGKMALVIESSDGILIKSAPEDPIEAACGFLGGSIPLSKDLIKDHMKESNRNGKSHSR
jgi:AbrB family looped-hinge helix DNA binding protein